jgi:hypothetical protein
MKTGTMRKETCRWRKRRIGGYQSQIRETPIVYFARGVQQFGVSKTFRSSLSLRRLTLHPCNCTGTWEDKHERKLKLKCDNCGHMVIKNIPPFADETLDQL